MGPAGPAGDGRGDPGTHRATDQRRTAWAAVDGSGRVVGAVVLIEPLRENRDTAGVWLSVHPEHWRQGVGSLLLSHAEAAAAAAGRSRIHEHNGEPHEVPGPGTLFARRHGYRQVLLDLRSDLALPLATERLEALADEAHDPAYALETAWDELPEGWLEDRALLARRMSTDAPTGGIDLEEEDWDAGRLRDRWARGRADGRRSVETVARHVATGRLVGYTDLEVAPGTPDLAVQGDTLVLREHRGHRLGLALKVANLRALQAALPHVTTLRTWNADTNTPMLAVNRRMGFEPTGVTREWLKDLAEPLGAGRLALAP